VLLLAKDTIDKLATSAKFAVAGIGLLAVASAIFSIVCGYRAAYGWPLIAKIENDADLRAWFEERSSWAQQRLARAVQLLHWSVYGAIAALVALTIAIGFLWLGPTDSPASPVVKVSYQKSSNGPQSVCGKLASLDAQTVVLNVTEGPRTSPQAIPVSSVTKTEVVSAC